MANSTRALFSINPPKGYTTRREVIEALQEDDYASAVSLLVAIVENVETHLDGRIAALEAR